MTEAHIHGSQELCEAGLELNARALSGGRAWEHEAGPMPCALSAGLLRPDLDGMRWPCPVPPAMVLPRLLRHIAKDIAHPAVLAHYAALDDDVEVRTIKGPRSPQSARPQGRVHPGQSGTHYGRQGPPPPPGHLSGHHLRPPLAPRHPHAPTAVQRPVLNGITPRQRADAELLIEGHTDAVIADRLGMNVRTCRVHIAKLATTFGSESRAQLGYLIAESGILKQEGATE